MWGVQSSDSTRVLIVELWNYGHLEKLICTPYRCLSYGSCRARRWGKRSRRREPNQHNLHVQPWRVFVLQGVEPAECSEDRRPQAYVRSPLLPQVLYLENGSIEVSLAALLSVSLLISPLLNIHSRGFTLMLQKVASLTCLASFCGLLLPPV